MLCDELCKIISLILLLNWNRLSSEIWVRRNMINMLEPWQPKGWRKPRKSMNRTWSTGPKSFPTRTTLTEVKRFCKYQLKKGQFDLCFFFKQGKESTIIIFPFFFWPCIKMWEPYRNFNYYQNFIPYESFFTVQVDELFWLLYMFLFSRWDWSCVFEDN